MLQCYRYDELIELFTNSAVGFETFSCRLLMFIESRIWRYFSCVVGHLGVFLALHFPWAIYSLLFSSPGATTMAWSWRGDLGAVSDVRGGESVPFLTAWIEQPFCTAYEQGWREPRAWQYGSHGHFVCVFLFFFDPSRNDPTSSWLNSFVCFTAFAAQTPSQFETSRFLQEVCFDPYITMQYYNEENMYTWKT